MSLLDFVRGSANSIVVGTDDDFGGPGRRARARLMGVSSEEFARAMGFRSDEEERLDDWDDRFREWLVAHGVEAKAAALLLGSLRETPRRTNAFGW